MLLLPAPLVSWPLVVTASSALYSIFLPISLIYPSTFSTEQNVFISGIGKAYHRSLKAVKNFWEFNTDSYFRYLRELRTVVCPNPFDISILQIFLSLIISVHGIAVDSAAALVLGIVYYIPILIKFYREIFNHYFNLRVRDMLLFFLLFVIVVVLNPVATALVVVALTGFGIYLGVNTAIEAYSKGFVKGIELAYSQVKEINELYEKLT